MNVKLTLRCNLENDIKGKLLTTFIYRSVPFHRFVGYNICVAVLAKQVSLQDDISPCN
jgi:hypothetical protein